MRKAATILIACGALAATTAHAEEPDDTDQSIVSRGLLLPAKTFGFDAYLELGFYGGHDLTRSLTIGDEQQAVFGFLGRL